MLAVTRFQVPEDQVERFRADAAALLDALAGRPGFQRGRLTQSVDESGLWALITEWDSPGSYRRGLSDHGVRLLAMPLLGWGYDEPSAFEVVAAHDVAVPASLGPSTRAR